MKNYNKILEAVNRGIQLALDDFDDDEVQNVKSKQVNHRDYTKEYLDLMEEVVDLGLPSGTLWCKYNLGVDQNQLSKPEDWYGDYYAWGDPKPNKTMRGNIILFPIKIILTILIAIIFSKKRSRKIVKKIWHRKH